MKILQELPIFFVMELAFSASGSALRFEELSLVQKVSYLFLKTTFQNSFLEFFKLLSMAKENLNLKGKVWGLLLNFHSSNSTEMLNNLETIKMLEPGLLPDVLQVVITKSYFLFRYLV